MDDRDFLAEALRLAAANVRDAGGPFGCVIVKDGEIIARGVNRVTADHDPTAHAEVQAVREACRRLGSHQLAGCTVYASCEPCPMCLGALYWARPDRVVFCGTRADAAAAGFDDSFIYDEIPMLAAERTLPVIHVDHPEREAPFRAWAEQADRLDY